MTAPAFLLPRLMKAPSAAAYLGMSESKLLTLPIPRKVDGRNRLYDRYDLDAYADSLPTEGETEGNEGNGCDDIFGVSG
ncbi:helix-turn-helix transcriptional regulator [Tropicimonas marinistellae]|uniref:helix-turn-helix transcriptional regulator n=1 Tax=Tropicimonas marinistellae TaxID=1739787 RepID=UPI000829C24E|nr:hypothetical protein [Tropicimonas marinistellae]